MFLEKEKEKESLSDSSFETMNKEVDNENIENIKKEENEKENNNNNSNNENYEDENNEDNDDNNNDEDNDNNDDDDINILLIGPSGSGKSLLINSIITYMRYDSLEGALIESSNASLATIPTIVSMSDSDDNQFNIKIGTIEDSEEEKRIVQCKSVTKKTKKYRIKNSSIQGSKTLCFIDTPGVLDSEGIRKDEENFHHILNEISKLKQLHAVCIIMKPNENRASQVFKFCINELLCHLHVSAKDNIFFCLSSTRSIHYRAGGSETKKLLALQLANLKETRNIHIELEKRTYCFDNESFNYLVCKKNGGNFSEFEESLYNLSWTTSVQELTRLLKDIISCKPHDIEKTLSINLARTMINQLIQPITICVFNINENLKAINEKKIEIENLNPDLEIDQLKKRLYTPFVNIKSLELDKRATICTNLKCISTTEKLVTTKDGQIKKLGYCCNTCNASSGKSVYSCKSIGLLGFCKVCSCYFTKHINIDTIEIREEIQLPLFNDDDDDGGGDSNEEGIKLSIKSKEEQSRISKDFLKSLQDRVEQYQNELNILTCSSVQFSSFLCKNSLLEYNDEIESYIQILISNEKSNGTNGIQSIKDLENYLESHKQQIDQFKNNLEKQKIQRDKKQKEKEIERGIFYQPSDQELQNDENEFNDNESFKSVTEIKLKINEILNLKYSGNFIKSKLSQFESLNKFYNNNNNINIDNNSNSNSNNNNNNNNNDNNNNFILSVKKSKRSSGMLSRIFNSFKNPK
ncbi:hypothetical protein DDB_G0276551 [Dictyostelium discoideum AX4]|uniref:Uncharacterized protein n=1 Tax=Dictyostelium discoideum TaxID=44689 RepID=Q551L7_DICDI|nr:hypothetical protein DDB_G0276551 [Dictyostelium discoideum AX4]EAL69229.1 hypothetical protein DDB_G0276551 [Dictyostelium discoideum AX4]|eukprot:XP_643113.1 hypothetical protein DDB_G0276551 [Dictyostelium discoideum AX4]